MNPAMIAMALQLLQSPQFAGMADKIPGLSSLTSLLGAPAAPAVQAQNNVTGALQLLVQHMPSDPAKAKQYAEAVSMVIQSLSVLQTLAV